MIRYIKTCVALLILLPCCSLALEHRADPARDILVTFENTGASAASGGFGSPYRNRKRYSIAANARRSAADIQNEYALIQIDHWPIRSLAVYCFVYRVPAIQDRDRLVERLRTDPRVESVQLLQKFQTSTIDQYNDPYASLQRGLAIIAVSAAHNYSRGHGVRIAIIDSNADTRHEDLRGRVKKLKDFTGKDRERDAHHGTAVTSIIAANTNNAKGIVGIAPEAEVELFVSCWAESDAKGAVCDSFTLAKAIDSVLTNSPQVLNLSLAGPRDPLVERLIDKALRSGIVVVAAQPTDPAHQFPGNMDRVIGVSSSGQQPATSKVDLFAPGEQIVVAIPKNGYDFRSGSSLAAAHISGVVALLLSVSPDLDSEAVKTLLQKSQNNSSSDIISIDACRALQLDDNSRTCNQDSVERLSLKLKPST